MNLILRFNGRANLVFISMGSRLVLDESNAIIISIHYAQNIRDLINILYKLYTSILYEIIYR